jgi:hypothetical protein
MREYLEMLEDSWKLSHEKKRTNVESLGIGAMITVLVIIEGFIVYYRGVDAFQC